MHVQTNEDCFLDQGSVLGGPLWQQKKKEETINKKMWVSVVTTVVVFILSAEQQTDLPVWVLYIYRKGPFKAFNVIFLQLSYTNRTRHPMQITNKHVIF